MGIRYAEITLRVKIPADDYDETLIDLLGDIEHTVQRQGIEYETIQAHTGWRGPDGA
jgi:hypothetical protein